MNLMSSAMIRGDVPALMHYNDETIALAQRSGDSHTLITSCAFRAQSSWIRALCRQQRLT